MRSSSAVGALVLCSALSSYAIGACPNVRPTSVAARHETLTPTAFQVYACSNVGIPPAEDWKWGAIGDATTCPSWVDWPAHYKRDCPPGVAALMMCCGPNLTGLKTKFESQTPPGASPGAGCTAGQSGVYGCEQTIQPSPEPFPIGSKKHCVEDVCNGGTYTTPEPYEVKQDNPE